MLIIVYFHRLNSMLENYCAKYTVQMVRLLVSSVLSEGNTLVLLFNVDGEMCCEHLQCKNAALLFAE